MPSKYITRSLEPILKRAASEFSAVLLTGPRQSGETALLQELFGQRYSYVSLEAPDVRIVAVEDPRGFLERYSPTVIMDAVQHVPVLLSHQKLLKQQEETTHFLPTRPLPHWVDLQQEPRDGCPVRNLV